MSSPVIWGPNGAINLQGSEILSTGASISDNGPKNYITFGNFENAATTGWSLGNVTLTANLPTGVPTFGSGASGNLSLATVTGASALAKTYSLSYVSSAVTTAGNFVASQAYAVDPEDRGKSLQINFSYKLASGTADFSATTSNSYAVAIYDVTNSAWVSVASPFNMNDGVGIGSSLTTFTCPATMASFRLVIYNANATGTAATLNLDTFLVGLVSAASNIVAGVSPTVQTFTSGSGTYTKPAGVQFIRVRMVGAGGGGAGSSTQAAADAGNGGTGGSTTFGSSLLSCVGGAGATFNANPSAGGTASLGAGPIGTALTGGFGSGVSQSPSGEVNAYSSGGNGGVTALGGGGGGGTANQGGAAGVANTGGGGGGAGSPSQGYAGAGGPSGGYIDAIITSPLATYAYAVGAAGTAGTAGTGGFAGAAGGSGYIEVIEYYTNLAVGNTATVAAGSFLSGPTSGANAIPTFKALQAPTVQTFTSGSGTYTKAAGALYLRVRIVGGGGGGAGGYAATPGGSQATDGGSGGSTTFGSSILTATGGTGGQVANASGQGGTGTIAGGAVGSAFTGSIGGGSNENNAGADLLAGGDGGSSPFGGSGGGTLNAAGYAAAANTGSGGAGAGTPRTISYSGSGGGSGGFIDAVITSPSATYAYAVGAAGTAGASATANSHAGGAGGSGYIEVIEYYQ